MLDFFELSRLPRPKTMSFEQLVVIAYRAKYGYEPTEQQWEQMYPEIAKYKDKSVPLCTPRKKRFAG